MQEQALDFDQLEVGYDIPARPGMALSQVQTPALIIDLDAFESNIARLQADCDAKGVALRVHGKMHKCATAAHYQIAQGAVGICCQKMSEAESFARAGIKDILLSNQVRDPLKIDRLARLPKLGCKLSVCVDDAQNIEALSQAAGKHGIELDILVELESGAGRCGVGAGQPALELAQAIISAPHLSFKGLQAYCGTAQHIYDYEGRKAAIDKTIEEAKVTKELLESHGIPCEIITGAGTGTYPMEAASGVYTEMQCGSYAFMDADYQRVLDEDGKPLLHFQNALFIFTSIMSVAKQGGAICDAGLKSQSLESGLPTIYGRTDIRYEACSDEHGNLADPNGVLRANDKLLLVPGHCDPTCNLHDYYVCIRGDKVEALWPITARGKSF